MTTPSVRETVDSGKPKESLCADASVSSDPLQAVRVLMWLPRAIGRTLATSNTLDY
jgi:uncharacterized membrane protein